MWLLGYLKGTFHLPYKDYFISLSNKTSRKKQQINFFNNFHSSVSDLKSVMALSYRSRWGHGPPPVYAL